jgi:hypothetical protein
MLTMISVIMGHRDYTEANRQPLVQVPDRILDPWLSTNRSRSKSGNHCEIGVQTTNDVGQIQVVP